MTWLRLLLLRFWIRRQNEKAEVGFVQQLQHEQDTVRINWKEEFGSDYAEHRGRRRR